MFSSSLWYNVFHFLLDNYKNVYIFFTGEEHQIVDYDKHKVLKWVLDIISASIETQYQAIDCLNLHM